MNRQHRGFTLVEVVAVLAMIGIIAAIAIPSYQSSIKKTRRTDAQSALMGFAAALERHYTHKSTYLGADDGADGKGNIPAEAVFQREAPLEGTVKYYDLRFTFTTTSYNLFAYPKGAQVGDGALRLSSTNARAWDKAGDGSFAASW